MTAQTSNDEALRWKKMRRLFDDVATLGPELRESYLQHLTDDPEIREAVRRLLAAHDAFDHLEALPGEAQAADDLSALVQRVQIDAEATIGDFRIERVLGEGGMGRVYYATRTIGGALQRVALKVVPFALRGARAVEQLRRERAILANLDHPNIARLIDAGELPDDRPYFAMEYVDGVPITHHCDRLGLDTRARLALFVDVCEAVAYAHRQLVLHRDVKPGNILVDTQGRVRLLDFGIGKSLVGQAAGHDTTADGGFFSLHSAAPEQLLGRATSVATDVYGLGCLMYQLLAGRTAFVFDAQSRDTVIGRILNEPPQLASESATAPAQRAALRGDVDRIIACALRKAPGERYPTVDALVADVRNVLEYRPIAARSFERWYRVRMFVRRHRTTVAVAAALGLAVFATTAVSIVQSQRAAEQRDRAVAALATSRRVTDFLVNAFRAAEPTQQTGSVLRVDDLLATATRSLDEGIASDDPALRATIAHTLTNLFYLLERPTDAARQTQVASEAVARLAAPSHEILASQALAEAQTAYVEHRYIDSSDAATRGLERLGDNTAIGNGELLVALWRMRTRAANNLELPLDQNVALFDAAIAMLSKRSDVTPDRIDALRQQRATVLSTTADRREEALQQLLALLAEQRERPRVEDAALVEIQRLIAQTYMRLGRHKESVPYIEEAYRHHLARFGDTNARTRILLTTLAGIYSNVGRNAESMMTYRHAIDLTPRTPGAVNPLLTQNYYNMGSNYYMDWGDLQQADYFLRRALETNGPTTRIQGARITRTLGEVMLLRGDYHVAGYYFAAARDVLIALRPQGDDRRFADINLAYSHFRRYDFETARMLLTPEAVAEVGRTNPAFPNNYRELKREVAEMTAFYGL